MSVLKTAQGIEKLQLDSNLNSSLQNVQNAIEEDLTINKVSMKKLTSGKVDDGSVSPPHGGKKRREEQYPSNPVWQVRENYTDDMIGLHREVKEFYEYIKPTSEEAEMRKFVVDHLREVISQLWPSMKMEVFGSYRTNLYLPTSDIDVVLLGECSCPGPKLFMLRDGLIHKGVAREETIRVLDRALVPIIKFQHKLVGVKVDISINQSKGLISVQYIKDFVKKFPTLPKLIFVIKQFLVSRDLNEVWHGGLSSYALIAMCISFLQLNPDPAARNSGSNLGVLLQEFFELYGVNFNYDKTCIRIKDGGRYISKHEFTSALDNGSPFSLLTIEDPLTEGNDLGRGSYAMHRVREAFQMAFRLLEMRQKKSKVMSSPPPRETMLEMVLRVPTDLHKNRQSCLDCWKTLKEEAEARRAQVAARIMPTAQPLATSRNWVRGSVPPTVHVVDDNDDEESFAEQACQIRSAERFTERTANTVPHVTTVHPKPHIPPVPYSKKKSHNTNHHTSAVSSLPPPPPQHQQITSNNSLIRNSQQNAAAVAIDPTSVVVTLQESAHVEPKRNGIDNKKTSNEYGDLREFIEDSKKNGKPNRHPSEKVRQNATLYPKNRGGGTATVSGANSNSSNRKFAAATALPSDRKTSSSSR